MYSTKRRSAIGLNVEAAESDAFLYYEDPFFSFIIDKFVKNLFDSALDTKRSNIN